MALWGEIGVDLRFEKHPMDVNISLDELDGLCFNGFDDDGILYLAPRKKWFKFGQSSSSHGDRARGGG